MKKLILLALLLGTPALAQWADPYAPQPGYAYPGNSGYYGPGSQGYYAPGNSGYVGPGNQGYYPGYPGYPDPNIPENAQGWLRGVPATTQGHRRAPSLSGGGYYLNGVYQHNGANNGYYNRGSYNRGYYNNGYPRY